MVSDVRIVRAWTATLPLQEITRQHLHASDDGYLIAQRYLAGVQDRRAADAGGGRRTHRHLYTACQGKGSDQQPGQRRSGNFRQRLSDSRPDADMVTESSPAELAAARRRFCSRSISSGGSAHGGECGQPWRSGYAGRKLIQLTSQRRRGGSHCASLRLADRRLADLPR